MTKKTIEQLLKEHKIDVKTGVWKHAQSGKTIVLHKALEQLASAMGIYFELPQLVNANQDAGSVALIVTGYTQTVKDDDGKVIEKARTEWSFGEATPKNNKNPYPFAMAEKRAKDRVILKLIGVHGEVYSDVEADDFARKNNYKATSKKSFGNKSDASADPFAGFDI